MNRKERRARKGEAKERGNREWEQLLPNQLISAGIEDFPDLCRVKWVYRNDFFVVYVFLNETTMGTVYQLSVYSVQKKHVSWDELQRIKNELVDWEAVAIEMFPRQSQVINLTPLRHLWVLPKTHEIPFGLHRKESWGRNNGEVVS